MKITTSKGKTLEINWMWGPLRVSGEVMLELNDGRNLSEIAADLEDCETIKKIDDQAAGKSELYEGYTVLRSINRNKETGAVQAALAKP